MGAMKHDYKGMCGCDEGEWVQGVRTMRIDGRFPRDFWSDTPLQCIVCAKAQGPWSSLRLLH